MAIRLESTSPVKASRGWGFTIIELVVVMAIIVLLVSILLPSLSRANDLVKQTTCLSRVSGQLEAIHVFAADAEGQIPVGPSFAIPLPGGYPGPAMYSLASNQIWIGRARALNAHGILVARHFVRPEMMFCPDDDSSDPQEELAKIQAASDEDAYCSYLYRQLDGRGPGSETKGRLGDLGLNARGMPVRALLMDMNSLLEIPGVPVRTNHRGRRVCVGFADGHAGIFPNVDQRLSLRRGDERRIFDRLDEILDYADTLQP